MSIRQLKTKLRNHLAKIREDKEIGEEVVANYEKAYEGLFEFAKANDRLVRRLAKVAETDGIDKVTQKEKINSIIREIFPTPEEYRAFEQRKKEVARNFLQQAHSALMADGKEGRFLGGIVGIIGKAIEGDEGLTQKIEENYLKNKIQEIYG